MRGGRQAGDSERRELRAYLAGRGLLAAACDWWDRRSGGHGRGATGLYDQGVYLTRI